MACSAPTPTRSTLSAVLPRLTLALLLVAAPGAFAQTDAPARETVPADDPDRWAALAHERLPMLEICRPEGAQEDMLCGTLEVWENRATEQGRRIPLNLVVVPAHTEQPQPDPIVSIGGGPGEAITGSAPFIPRFAPEIVAERDVLLVDQRGTGGSNGLYCTFGITPENPQVAYDAMFPFEGVERCLDVLEERADLTQYTTSIAVDDLEEVRRWLGYGPINLEGGSYGTRFVQDFLRRHPESVRAAVMSGVTSMDHRMPLNHAQDGQRSLDLLIALCEEDAACDGAFPNLRTELWELLERLEEEPGRATLDNPLNPGQEITLEVGRGMFAEALRSLLYTVRGSTELPFVVHRAWEGDFEPFFRVTVPRRFFVEREIANGLYFSITCAEDTHRFTEGEAVLHNAGTASGDYRTDAQKAACSIWPRAEVPEAFNEPVETDRPVLILVGELDPVTPPRYGRKVAEQMPNSRFVLVPRGHHAFDSLTHQECLEGIGRQFLETASVEGLDTSCVRTMERPPFVVDEAGMSYMRQDGPAEEKGGEADDGVGEGS